MAPMILLSTDTNFSLEDLIKVAKTSEVEGSWVSRWRNAVSRKL